MVSDSKRYPCEHCGKSFVRLRKHHDNSHPNLPFNPMETAPIDTSAERQHTCSVCAKKFASSAHLRRHELEVHLAEHFSCPFAHCNKQFKHQSTVNRHVAKVHSNPEVAQSIGNETPEQVTDSLKLECNICHKKYKFESRLKSHMKSHRKKDFECNRDGCNVKFSSESDLKKHVATKHDGAETAEPNESTAATPDAPRSKKKSNGKRFACSYCDKSFGNRGHLNRHERTHTGEKPFTCDFENCGQSFPRKENLQYHINSVHKLRAEREKYKCPQCDEDFLKESGLAKHLEKHKLGLLYTCELCSKVFGKKWKLNRHLSDVHGHQGNFVCEHENCDERFFRLSLLQLHIRRRHTLHFCFEPECSEVDPFSSRNELMNHNRKFHPPPDGFICEKCGRQCYSERGYSRHLNWHEEMKSKASSMFPCDYPFCKQQFTSRIDLVKHVSEKHLRKRQRKDSEIQLHCPICAENLPNRTELFNHLEKQHEIEKEKVAEVAYAKLRTRKRRKAGQVNPTKETAAVPDGDSVNAEEVGPIQATKLNAPPRNVENEKPGLNQKSADFEQGAVPLSSSETENVESSSYEIENVEIHPAVLNRGLDDEFYSSDEHDEDEIVYMDESSDDNEIIYVEGLEDDEVAVEPSGNVENAWFNPSEHLAPAHELFPTSNQRAELTHSSDIRNPLLMSPKKALESN